MASGAWRRSGVRPATGGRQARPGGSFSVALARARGVWDELTGGPDGGVPLVGSAGCTCVAPGELVMVAPGTYGPGHRAGCDAGGGVYSVEAAAAIVGLALGLWADTAAAMGAEDNGDG